MTTTININDAEHMLTVRDMVRWAVTYFNEAELVYGHGTENAWDDAVNLILTTLHLSPDINSSVLDARLTPTEKQTIAERVKRRVEERIPVPYLVNEAWFAGLSFYVDSRVVIPRSPIAELLEDALSPWIEESNVERILDLCTGSGCIAITAALTFSNAKVDAIDMSEDALAVAKINVARFGVEDNVRLIQSDLFTELHGERYDLILSNPPYVSKKEYATLPPEYAYEPKMALESGEEGLDAVRQILVHAEEYLTPTGILVVEVGEAQMSLESYYPKVPFTWLQFEHGGEGVFVLTAEELRECRTWLKRTQ